MTLFFLFKSFDSLKDNLPPMSSVLAWEEQMWGLCGTISRYLPEKQLLVSSPRCCNKRNHLSGDQLSVTPLAIANITFKATFQKSFSRDCTLCWIPPFSKSLIAILTLAGNHSCATFPLTAGSNGSTAQKEATPTKPNLSTLGRY